jgi:hypothetical protein
VLLTHATLLIAIKDHAGADTAALTLHESLAARDPLAPNRPATANGGTVERKSGGIQTNESK